MEAESLIITVPSSGPVQKPRGEAETVKGTPAEFMEALVGKFGKPTWDLAATKYNAKAENFFTEEDNSLIQDWHKLDGILYLNPPFDPVKPWTEKCRKEAEKGAKILLLTMASVDANWFWEDVWGHAYVLAVDRIKFEGENHVFPKPLILSCYGFGVGLGRWRWKKSKRKEKS